MRPLVIVLSFGVVGSLRFSRLPSSRRTVLPRCAVEPTQRAFEGMPSTPGYRPGQLNRLTDWAVRDSSNRPVICEFRPDGLWLWTKWRGTVLSFTVVPVLFMILLAFFTDALAHHLSATAWAFPAMPPVDDPFIRQLKALNDLWEYQLTLTTFILTFFTSQAYSHWKQVYFTTRAIQGRINDICLLLSLGAERGGGRDGVTTTGYSDEAAQLVRLCTRLIRLSHTFFWAATPTSSDGVGDGGMADWDNDRDASNSRGTRAFEELRRQVLGVGEGRGDDWFVSGGEEDASVRSDKIGPLLLSEEGLARLVAAGELTRAEASALQASGLPPSQYAYVLLEWVGLRAMQGLRNGTLAASPGFEENLLRQFTGLRAEYFSIPDLTSGRMVLAYVQLVQVLVDSLVILAPFALYSALGLLSVPATGLLTLFFKGLLELSKSFLDPFGTEGSPGQNIRVDVLVSELNFGAGSRWLKAGEVLPEMSDPDVELGSRW